MAYKKSTGDIPEINVPAVGQSNVTDYYIGLEKQDEDKEFENNLDIGESIQNTTTEWCNVNFIQNDNTGKRIILETTTNQIE